jgi:hypothetical protein
MDKKPINTERKSFSLLSAAVTRRSVEHPAVTVELADKDLEYKYYIEVYEEPGKVATELRRIAKWLDTLK